MPRQAARTNYNLLPVATPRALPGGVRLGLPGETRGVLSSAISISWLRPNADSEGIGADADAATELERTRRARQASRATEPPWDAIHGTPRRPPTRASWMTPHLNQFLDVPFRPSGIQTVYGYGAGSGAAACISRAKSAQKEDDPSIRKQLQSATSPDVV